MIGTAGECAYTLAKVSRPELSGSDRSRITSAVSPAERCSRPFARRSAQCSANGARGSSPTISRMSRSSPGLSSIRRTWCISISVRRERHHGQPENVDRLHHRDELLEVDRLRDVAVGVQVVALQHVLLRLGGGEHHHRNAAQMLIGLDLLQHFAAVLLRQVQVEQDDVGARRILVLAALVQKLHGVDTVLRPVQLVIDLAFLQRLARQALIARVVLHQQDLNGRAAIHHGHSFFGSVKWTVLRAPGVEVPQMRPPWRSATFLQMARPMPVPGYSPMACSRWNSMKMRSKYCGSMPMPLSATLMCHSPASSCAPTWMWGARSLLRNLSALPIRFWNTCASCTSSPSTVGSASAVTAAPDSWIAACKLVRARLSGASSDTGTSSLPLVPTRE